MGHFYAGPPWVSITQVCRKWRQVSVGYPHLWRMIPNDLPTQWIDAHFERSKNVPLIVQVDLECEKWTVGACLLPLLLANTHRIEEFHLSGRSTANQLVLNLCKFVDAAPLLQSLIIDGYEDGDRDHLPLKLFAGFTPRLQLLKLSYCLGLQCSSSFLTELRQLHYIFPSSIESVIKLLKEMPKLEVLVLEGFAEDWNRADDIIISDTVQLPFLKRLFFTAIWLEDFSGFMAYCQFPPSARIDLKVGLEQSDMPRDDQWVNALDLVVTRHLQPSHQIFGHFQDIYINIGRKSVKVMGWTSGQPPELDKDTHGPWYTSLHEFSRGRPQPNIPFCLAYPGDGQEVWNPYIDLSSTCLAFDVTHVRHAWFSVDATCVWYRLVLLHELPFILKAAQSTSWIPTLRLLQSVEVLKASGVAVLGILRALVSVGLDLPEQQPAEPTGILCSNLHTLVIMDVKFSRQELLLLDLLELVERRHQCGAGISELVLQNCDVGDEEVRMLARYTKVTLWQRPISFSFFADVYQ